MKMARAALKTSSKFCSTFGSMMITSTKMSTNKSGWPQGAFATTMTSRAPVARGNRNSRWRQGITLSKKHSNTRGDIGRDATTANRDVDEDSSVSTSSESCSDDEIADEIDDGPHRRLRIKFFITLNSVNGMSNVVSANVTFLHSKGEGSLKLMIHCN